MELKSKVPWTSDGRGELRGVSVHDGMLLEFRSSMVEQSFVIKNQESQIVEIILGGVTDFNVVELWPGAIVSEIFVWQLANVPDNVWDLADGAWPMLFKGRGSLEDARKSAARLTNSAPSAYLFQLLCSYGGAFATACRDVAVYTRG